MYNTAENYPVKGLLEMIEYSCMFFKEVDVP